MNQMIFDLNQQNFEQETIVTNYTIQNKRKKTKWIKWVPIKPNQTGNYTVPEVCVYFDHKLLRGNRTVKVDLSLHILFQT